MDIASALILFGAGLLAGAMNAAASGGSFVTIPAMVSVGLPSVAANASSTVALLPGTLASTWAWRRDFRPFEGIPLRTMLLIRSPPMAPSTLIEDACHAKLRASAM